MKRDSGPPLDQWFVQFVDKVNDALLETAEDVADKGQDMVQGVIETSGTGRTWKRTYYRNPGGPRSGSLNGRIWSGDMHADVEQQAMKLNKNLAFARFGWIFNYEEYYGMQEVGFEHPITGEVVGMYAMAYAEDNIMKYASDQLGKRLRNV